MTSESRETWLLWSSFRNYPINSGIRGLLAVGPNSTVVLSKRSLFPWPYVNRRRIRSALRSSVKLLILALAMCWNMNSCSWSDGMTKRGFGDVKIMFDVAEGFRASRPLKLYRVRRRGASRSVSYHS